MKIIKDKSISNIFINEIAGPITIEIGIIEKSKKK
tara:strand:- start:286 stop:390 length:105 start_codon:yes stop_codon:yes gene_type:complete